MNMLELPTPPAWRKPDPVVIWFWAVRHWIGMSILLAVPSVALGELWLGGYGPMLPLVGVLLAAPLALVYARAAYRRYGFRLEDDGLVLRQGVFWRSETYVPSARIQHADLQHGPIDRRLDLASVVLHCSGLRTAAITLPALPAAEAESIRDRLLERASGER